MIHTQCPKPNCSRVFKITTEMIGRKANCKTCGTQFRIRDGVGELLEANAPIPRSSKQRSKPTSTRLATQGSTPQKGDDRGNGDQPLEQILSGGDSVQNSHMSESLTRKLGDISDRMMPLVKAVTHYYMKAFIAFVEFVIVEIGGSYNRRVVLRVNKHNSSPGVHWDESNGWKIEFSRQCIVCGTDTNQRRTISDTVTNPVPPIAILVGTCFFLLVMKMFGVSFWILFPLFIAGTFASYAIRNVASINVTYGCCDEHLSHDATPRFRSFVNDLIITAGQTRRVHDDARRTIQRPVPGQAPKLRTTSVEMSGLGQWQDVLILEPTSDAVWNPQETILKKYYEDGLLLTLLILGTAFLVLFSIRILSPLHFWFSVLIPIAFFAAMSLAVWRSSYRRYAFSALADGRWQFVVSTHRMGSCREECKVEIAEGAKFVVPVVEGIILEGSNATTRRGCLFSEHQKLLAELTCLEHHQLKSFMLLLSSTFGIPFEDELIMALNVPEMACCKNAPRRISLRGVDAPEYLVAMPQKNLLSPKGSYLSRLLKTKIDREEVDVFKDEIVVVPLVNIVEFTVTKADSQGKRFLKKLLVFMSWPTVVGFYYAVLYLQKGRFSTISFLEGDEANKMLDIATLPFDFGLEDLQTTEAVEAMLRQHTAIREA